MNKLGEGKEKRSRKVKAHKGMDSGGKGEEWDQNGRKDAFLWRGRKRKRKGATALFRKEGMDWFKYRKKGHSLGQKGRRFRGGTRRVWKGEEKKSFALDGNRGAARQVAGEAGKAKKGKRAKCAL